MGRYIEWVLDQVLSIDGPALYALAFGLAMSETAFGLGWIVPGELGLVFVGLVGHRNEQSLAALVTVAFVGAVVGDSISYWLGRRYGARLIARTGRLRRYLEPRMERARDYFEERGGSAVFVGRWVAAMRALVPAVAGMNGMQFPRFVAWNVAASAGWATTVVVLGWIFAAPITSLVRRASGWVAWGAVALFILYEAVSWHRHRRAREEQVREH